MIIDNNHSFIFGAYKTIIYSFASCGVYVDLFTAVWLS